jgi:hypothetical protein
MSRNSSLFVTIALGTALGVGGAEAIARLARIRPLAVERADYIGWARPDPVLGWRNNPGVHRADEGSHEPMTILPDGTRASGTPATARTPVLIVGCSFAAGYGVRDDEVFAWKLQQHFPHLRIRNCAVPGYGTYQSLLLLEELIQQQGEKPALVIYGFLPFHADRNVLTYSMLEAFRAFGGERFSPPHVELRNGGLAAFPPFMVPNWPQEEHSALVTLLHSAELRVRLANREQQREQVTALLLEQMKRLVEGAHARLLVATLGNGGSRAESYRRMTLDMRQAGIDELDVTYQGAETRPEKIRVGGKGHPGAIVHSWWADKLGQWLSEQRIGELALGGASAVNAGYPQTGPANGIP